VFKPFGLGFVAFDSTIDSTYASLFLILSKTMIAEILSKTLFLSHWSVALVPSSSVTETSIVQKVSGTNHLILSACSTTNPMVGVWQGP
jgi:hypothetical protein